MIILAFAGSLYLPNNLAFFSGIDDAPLFDWLKSSGDIRLTWWIYGIVVTLSLVAVNTIACTVKSLIERLDWKNAALKLSPQIMHAGVLLTMLGHLLTAYIGLKTDLLIKQGEGKTIYMDKGLYLKDVKILKDSLGYDADWEVSIAWLENGKEINNEVLKAAHPSFLGNLGVFFKSATVEPEKSVQVRVSQDPGALWALLGGLIFSFGGLFFIYGRFNAE